MSIRQLAQVLWRLLSYIRPYWKIVLGALLLTVVVTAARLSQAKFVGLIMGMMSQESFSYSDGQDPFMRLNLICLAFLAVMAVMGASTYFQRYTIDLGGQQAVRDFRDQVFAHLQRLPMAFFDRMRLGEIHSRASNDILLSTSVYMALSDFIKNLLVVVACLSWMFYRDWQMTLVVLLISPLVGTAVANFGKRMGQRSEKLQARLADLSALLYENISTIKVVKAYTREDFEVRRFACRNEDNFAAQMKLVQVSAIQSPVVELLGAFGIVAIVWFGATRVMQGQVTFAQMTEYWTLMVMTSHPISALSGFYGTANSAAAAGRRVFELMDMTPEVAEPEGALELPRLQGAIDFESVHFHYDPEKPVLRGINLSIRPGEVVAVVGANGAGKTTLVNMVPRFYDPVSGSVKVDGHDLKDVKLRSLRTQIGTVIQESVLFGGTIDDNIRCGNPTATDEEVLRASKLANAHEFIERMPDGYQTEVGERGLRLSGGQRQRIAIARALLRDPRILILDEYTSGIDAESENLIADAIARAMEGRTCLVIAHRLNTIRHADRILVLDAGQIDEEGRHDKLMARTGIYSRLYEAQLREPLRTSTETEVPE